MSAAYWTRERIIAALQAWYAKHGRAPAKVADWGRSGPHHPPASSVDARFGSWNAAVRAAGIPTNPPGIPSRLSKDEVAAVMLDWLLSRGSWPTETEWDGARMRPSRCAVERLFGSWNDARRYAGWRASCDNCDRPLTKGRRRWCSERCRHHAFRHGVRVAPTAFACAGCGGDEYSETIGCKSCWDRLRKRAVRAAVRSGAAEVVELLPWGSDLGADGGSHRSGRPADIETETAAQAA